MDENYQGDFTYNCQVSSTQSSRWGGWLNHSRTLLADDDLAQRSYFIKCNPRKNAHHQLPIAKMKLLNVLNPKMITSRTIFVGHQGVLVD